MPKFSSTERMSVLFTGLAGFSFVACGANAPTAPGQASRVQAAVQASIEDAGAQRDDGTDKDGAGNDDSAASSSDRTVTTPGGAFPEQSYRGSRENGVTSFLGIRYAAPPSGPLRFSAPQAPAPAADILPATHPGSPCPQSASPFGTASTQEDCLFLNVYVPASARSSRRAALPVMVFFHGGDFVYGEGSLYDPTDLAVQGDVIVVTINYRLGILGYMAHPALSKTSATQASGNYGLQDQQFALRWVRQNISAFGGNPSNVTIFGESAGGFSVCANIVSPAAAGLFARAITESGPCSFSLPTRSAQEAQGSQIGTALGCAAGTPAEVAGCLRGASIDKILAVQSTVTASNSLSSIAAFFPDVDGVLIPEQPVSSIALGQYNHVPVMEGTNLDEGSLFVAIAFDLNPAVGPLTAAGYPAAVSALAASLIAQSGTSGNNDAGQIQQVTQQILNEYPLSRFGSPDAALSAVFTDAGFSCQAYVSNELFSLQVPTFGYELTDPGAAMLFLPPATFPYGPTHTDELPYLFSFAEHASPLQNDQRALANTMKAYWTNFAKNGNPNGIGIAYWPPGNAVTGSVQSLEPPTPSAETDFSSEHRCSFWSGVLLQTTLAGIANQLASLGGGSVAGRPAGT